MSKHMEMRHGMSKLRNYSNCSGFLITSMTF